jgi:hypothetical protein
MQIKFSDSRIKEFSQGMNLHFKNDGKPIDVSAATAGDLLNHKQPPPDNPAAPHAEWINTFEVVGATKKEAKNYLATYPDGFPSAEKLANKYDYASALLLSKEQLMEIDGIGEKSADAIIEFSKEK